MTRHDKAFIVNNVTRVKQEMRQFFVLGAVFQKKQKINGYFN